MPTLRSAADLSLSELTALWNAAYEGYLVPLTFDEALVARHVRRSGIDLARSAVGLVDGAPFGLSLAAFREDRAWIGGFGVAAPFRRRGLATALLAAHLAQIDAAGVSETWLEVIDANPAREVYRRCRFSETRELLLLEGAPAAGDDDAAPLPPARLAEAHAALNPVRPSWRRDLPTLLDGVAEGAVALGVDRNGEVRAYALAFEHGGRLVLFDAAAADAEAGAALFGSLGRRWPGLPIRLVDEPAGTPLACAAEAAGLAVGLRQVEMRRFAPAA